MRLNNVLFAVMVCLVLTSCATVNKAVDEALGRNPSVKTLYYDADDIAAYMKELDAGTAADEDSVRPGPEPDTFIVTRGVLVDYVATKADATLKGERIDEFARKHKDMSWGRALLTDLVDVVVGFGLALWLLAL